MFPSLFGHPNSPLTQRYLGPVLQQLDGFLTTPRAPQALLQPRPIRRRQRLYTLSVTLKMFLTQCLSDDPSCRTAVATAKERGWLPQAASPDTGAYCRARDNLSPSGLAALVARTGGALENVCQPEQSSMARASPYPIPLTIKWPIRNLANKPLAVASPC